MKGNEKRTDQTRKLVNWIPEVKELFEKRDIQKLVIQVKGDDGNPETYVFYQAS